MAVLETIPNGDVRELPGPGVFITPPAPAAARFAVVPYRRRWLLFDVSGTTRVDAAPVGGGVATLGDGALISAGGERLRFVRNAGGTIVTADAPRVCSYCRDGIAAGEQCRACGNCGRVQHEACSAEAGVCGRCGSDMT